MALLKLNQRTLELTAEVGAKEHYKPDEEIQVLVKDLERVRSNLNEKIVALFGEGLTQTQIIQKAKEDDKLEEQLKEYLQGEHKTDMQSLIERINKKNEQICPGYKEFRGYNP